jgi:hypothetical protein
MVKMNHVYTQEQKKWALEVYNGAAGGKSATRQQTTCA